MASTRLLVERQAIEQRGAAARAPAPPRDPRHWPRGSPPGAPGALPPPRAARDPWPLAAPSPGSVRPAAPARRAPACPLRGRDVAPSPWLPPAALSSARLSQPYPTPSGAPAATAAGSANSSTGSARPRIGCGADRGQFAPDVAGERRRGQQRLTQGLAQGLDPAHQVDRRTDHGEVEAALAADVAVDHPPDVRATPNSSGAAPAARRARLAAARALRARRARPPARAGRCARGPAGGPIGNTASRPSPMNLRTSPPATVIASTRAW